jgi:hypothetical protein
MPIKIEKNVPFQSKRGKWNSVLHKMEVGDSFVIPKTKKLLHSVVAIKRAAKSLNMVMNYRTFENKEVRFWRIE